MEREEYVPPSPEEIKSKADKVKTALFEIVGNNAQGVYEEVAGKMNVMDARSLAYQLTKLAALLNERFESSKKS